jgi:hypothetical protein
LTCGHLIKFFIFIFKKNRKKIFFQKRKKEKKILGWPLGTKGWVGHPLGSPLGAQGGGFHKKGNESESG